MFRFVPERLASLFRTLEISDLRIFFSLLTVSRFAALVSTYTEGYLMLWIHLKIKTLINWNLYLVDLSSSSNLLRIRLPTYRIQFCTSGLHHSFEYPFFKSYLLCWWLMKYSCLDASIAVKSLLNRFPTVVITPGALSTLNLYPKLLGFQSDVMSSFTMPLTRPPILPMV